MVRAAVLVLLAAGCLGDPKKPLAGDAGTDSASTDGPVGSGAVVFGDDVIEQGGDRHDCGTPEAASFTTGSSPAKVHSLWIYISDSGGDDARRIDAAIYDSSTGGDPTTLAASGHLEMASALPLDSWYQVPLATAFQPQANHIYWIAAMCPQGYGTSFTIAYKYFGAGGGGACDATQTQCTQHGQSNETTFDTTWTMTATYLPSTNSYYASE